MEDYGYKAALKAAGATVHEFQEFGSYQGDWYAFVSYDGEHGFIHDYYGSCSGCDAFEAEVGYKYSKTDDAYQQELATFGKSYLNNILSLDDALATTHPEYGIDDQEGYDWLLATAKKYEHLLV